jgi:hypothetical protein
VHLLRRQLLWGLVIWAPLTVRLQDGLPTAQVVAAERRGVKVMVLVPTRGGHIDVVRLPARRLVRKCFAVTPAAVATAAALACARATVAVGIPRHNPRRRLAALHFETLVSLHRLRQDITTSCCR